MKKYYEFLDSKHSLILDIYTICRSFKYLSLEGPKPVMNIIYAGDYHIKNIVFFLEKITELYKVDTLSLTLNCQPRAIAWWQGESFAFGF